MNRSNSLDRSLKLSVIIPAYNEESAISDTIARITELKINSLEILVINDGSTDNTEEVARTAGAKVISHPLNIGNGAAVKTGIRNANGELLVFIDGDGQHNPEDILKMIPHLEQYHMVVGARKKGSEGSWHRNLANIVFNLFASFIAQFKIEDLTSGFRAMRRDDAIRFCDMLPNKFSYPTTSTLAFLRSGRSVKYVPIRAKTRIGTSKIKIFRDGSKFLLIIIKIAMTFSPLRIFLPVSCFIFASGIVRYIYTFTTEGRFTNMSHLLINSSIVILLLGLIADQIASLRFERGDKVFTVEDNLKYQEIVRSFNQLESLEKNPGRIKEVDYDPSDIGQY